MSSNNPNPSLALAPAPIPHPPSFSSFKFKTIGQPPDLLKRFSDSAAAASPYDEQEGDDRLGCHRSSPAPIKSTNKNGMSHSSERTGRVTLLQALSHPDANMAMDTDTIVTSTSATATTGAPMERTGLVVNCNSNGTGTGTLNNNALPVQLESSHSRQTMIVDLAPATEIQAQARIHGHDYDQTPIQAQIQDGEEGRNNEQNSTSFNTALGSPTPTPELLYPSGLVSESGSGASNGTTANSTSIAMSNILALRNRMEERTAILKARSNASAGTTNMNANHDDGLPAACFQSLSLNMNPVSQVPGDTRLSPLSLQEPNVQNQSNLSSSPNAPADHDMHTPEHGSSLSSSAQTRTQTLPHLSITPPLSPSDQQQHYHQQQHLQPQSQSQHPSPSSQTLPFSHNPLDSAFDSAKKYLDALSLARAHVAQADEDTRQARRQAAIARAEAQDMSTLLGESRARNARLDEENAELKLELARLREEMERVRVRGREEAREIVRLVDELVRDSRAKEEEGQREKEDKEYALKMATAQRQAEEKEEKERARAEAEAEGEAEAEAEAEEQKRRQRDAEIRLQREREQEQEEQKQLEREREDHFVKKRAEVMKEKERANQENADRIRAARESKAVSSSFASVSANTSERAPDAKANGRSSNGENTDETETETAEDRTAVTPDTSSLTAQAQNQNQNHNHNPPVLESQTNNATSIFHKVVHHQPHVSVAENEKGRGPVQSSSAASHTINLRHLKALGKKASGAGAVVNQASVEKKVETTTKTTADSKVKTEMNLKREDDGDVAMKVEEDELMSPYVGEPEPQPEHQASPLPQLRSTSQSHSHSQSHSPIETEPLLSGAISNVTSPTSVIQHKELCSPSSHGTAPPISNKPPPSKHLAADVARDILPGNPTNQPRRPLPQRPSHLPPSAPMSTAGPFRPPDYRRRPSASGREAMPSRRHYSPPSRPLTPPLPTYDHYSPPPAGSNAQPYSPPPSPPPTTRRARPNKRRRPQEDNGPPARRQWREDPSYQRPTYASRAAVEPRYEHSNMQDVLDGPRTPPLPGRDYHTPEPEPQVTTRYQPPPRSPPPRSRVGASDSYRPVRDSEQYEYGRQRQNTVRSEYPRTEHQDWEYQVAYGSNTYEPTTGSSTSGNVVLSRTGVDDRLQGPTEPPAWRQQSPPQDPVSLLDRMSDAKDVPPSGPQAQTHFQNNNHNRRVSSQTRGGGQNARGGVQSRTSRGRGGARGGAAGNGNSTLASRLALQDRLS